MREKSWKFDNVRCPKCGESFDASETLSQQLATRLRQELERELRGKEQALSERERGLERKEAEIDKAVEQKLAEVKGVIQEEAARKAATDHLTQLEDLWPAPGLDDTDLSEAGPALELHRA